MRVRPLLLAVALFGALALCLPAQVVISGAAGMTNNPHQPRQLGTVAGQVGISLPPMPHVMLLWNMVSVGLDRQAGRNGAAFGTGLEAWVSPSPHPAQSWGPLLLAEATVGRRWGPGLHGYTALGAGAGWSLGDWVPYVEYRRRTSFHAGRPVDRQIVVGLKFVLFG